MHTGAVILAAGGSTRLGTPKQLLVYGGKTLLRRAAEAARAVVDGPVVVTLGRDVSAGRALLAGLDVRIVENPDWALGMGASVRLGIAALSDEADAALLMLCDQPLVTADGLARLLAAHAPVNADGAGIAAAAYHDTVGVPAVFGRAYFGELRSLPEDAGAKPLLRRHRDRVIPVLLPEAATDIDTIEQYAQLVGSSETFPGKP